MKFIKITEQDSNHKDLEKKSITELVAAMHEEDNNALKAVNKVLPKVVELIKQIEPNEKNILLHKKNNHSIKIIGTRHGEKKHETLLTAEERIYSKENDDFYIITPDNRNLNYEEYFSKGSEKISNETDYSSNNTNQLNVNDLVSLIKKSQSLTI